MNFKNFITALVATLLLFVIDVQDSDVVKHELIIANFDSVAPDQAQVILGRIQQDLDVAGVSQVSLKTLVNGNLSITYHSDLNPTTVLEFFSLPSICDWDDASVYELLIHVDLAITVKDLVPASHIPSGCDGVLTHEFKTDVDRHHAGQRLIALSSFQTDNHLPTFYNCIKVASNSSTTLLTQSHVLIPESRAGPVA